MWAPGCKGIINDSSRPDVLSALFWSYSSRCPFIPVHSSSPCAASCASSILNFFFSASEKQKLVTYWFCFYYKSGMAEFCKQSWNPYDLHCIRNSIIKPWSHQKLKSPAVVGGQTFRAIDCNTEAILQGDQREATVKLMTFKLQSLPFCTDHFPDPEEGPSHGFT